MEQEKKMAAEQMAFDREMVREQHNNTMQMLAAIGAMLAAEAWAAEAWVTEAWQAEAWQSEAWAAAWAAEAWAAEAWPAEATV